MSNNNSLFENLKNSGNLKIAGVKIYGSHDLQVFLSLAAAVFEKLGVPVAEKIKSLIAVGEPDKNLEMEILSGGGDGVCFVADAQKLFLGDYGYISGMGLTVPREPELEDEFAKNAGLVVILASETEVLAKMYLQVASADELPCGCGEQCEGSAALKLIEAETADDAAKVIEALRQGENASVVLNCEKTDEETAKIIIDTIKAEFPNVQFHQVAHKTCVITPENVTVKVEKSN